MKRFYFLAASIGLLAACSGLEQPEQDLLMDDGAEQERVRRVLTEAVGL